MFIEREDIKNTIFKSMQEQNSDFISIEENLVLNSKLDNRCVHVEFLRIQIIWNKSWYQSNMNRSYPLYLTLKRSLINKNESQNQRKEEQIIIHDSLLKILMLNYNKPSISIWSHRSNANFTIFFISLPPSNPTLFINKFEIDERPLTLK